MQPAERERFDEAALAAAEGCVTAHLKEVSEEAKSLEQAHVAAQARSRRIVAEMTAAKERRIAAGESLAAAGKALKESNEDLRKALAAVRRQELEVKALATEA